jgi:pantoate--beta-alanine ligase
MQNAECRIQKAGASHSGFRLLTSDFFQDLFMKTISSISHMQEHSDGLRAGGYRMGFVPTMGFLHEGHMSLIRHAREENDVLAASIFVNPIQFGPGEDFETYPRDLENDSRLCLEAGCDVLFTPSASHMYPEDRCTVVSVSRVTDGLCGASRPGHFDGVGTVVAKLLNIVKPHRAYFGLKDYQQYIVIDRMVRDLNMDVEIIGLPTIRESDGLAMSSRNSYLTGPERKSALSLSRSLELARRMVADGTRDASEVVDAVRENIRSEPHTRIDYVSVVHPMDLTPVQTIRERTLLALSVFIGKARLIDNTILTPGTGVD